MCDNSSRTFLCCSHVAGVTYFNAHARYELKIPKPSTCFENFFKNGKILPVLNDVREGGPTIRWNESRFSRFSHRTTLWISLGGRNMLCGEVEGSNHEKRVVVKQDVPKKTQSQKIWTHFSGPEFGGKFLWSPYWNAPWCPLQSVFFFISLSISSSRCEENPGKRFSLRFIFLENQPSQGSQTLARRFNYQWASSLWKLSQSEQGHFLVGTPAAAFILK